jgi:hypothetical protein
MLVPTIEVHNNQNAGMVTPGRIDDLAPTTLSLPPPPPPQYCHLGFLGGHRGQGTPSPDQQSCYRNSSCNPIVSFLCSNQLLEIPTDSMSKMVAMTLSTMAMCAKGSFGDGNRHKDHSTPDCCNLRHDNLPQAKVSMLVSTVEGHNNKRAVTLGRIDILAPTTPPTFLPPLNTASWDSLAVTTDVRWEQVGYYKVKESHRDKMGSG